MAFAFFLANAGAILGAYISLRIGQARLEVKVDNLEGDMNGLGENHRRLEDKFDQLKGE